MIRQLSVENLCIARGGRRLIEELEFVLKAGEALSVVGPNGVGKTSLLRTVAGLMSSTEGRITFSGEAGPLDEDEARAKGLHLLGHKDGLKTTRQGREELEFWGAWSGAAAPSIKKAVEVLHLEALLSLSVADLSAGQRRRLALARLIAAPRPLWLLDEPFAPLDLVNRRRFGVLLTEHLQSGGLVLAAVHDPLPIPCRVLELTAL